MRIDIQERYLPFSHQPGTLCLIPKTFVSARIFPGKIEFHDLKTDRKEEVFFDLQGLVKPFTVETDLERGRIRVSGLAPSGYFSYRIEAEAKGVALTLERGKVGDLQKLLLPFSSYEVEKNEERLFLGVSKHKDWEKIKSRCDFREIFPLWLKMAQFCPKEKEKFSFSDHSLPYFEKLFLSYFTGVFVPRRTDDDHQNLLEPLAISPFSLLQDGAEMIRSLFFQEEAGKLHFLPLIPSAFTCGRFTSLTFSLGKLSMEWSKKNLRRVMMRIEKEGKLQIHLQNSKECRVRFSRNEKGEVFQSGSFLQLTPGEVYFDRFIK